MTKAELLVALKRLEDDEDIKVLARGAVCEIYGYEMHTHYDGTIEMRLRARREGE